MPRLGLQATSLPDLVNFNLICQSAVSRKAVCVHVCVGIHVYRREEEGGEKWKEWRPHSFLIKLETEAAINHYYLEKLKLAVRMCFACRMHTRKPFVYANACRGWRDRFSLCCLYAIVNLHVILKKKKVDWYLLYRDVPKTSLLLVILRRK